MVTTAEGSHELYSDPAFIAPANRILKAKTSGDESEPAVPWPERAIYVGKFGASRFWVTV